MFAECFRDITDAELMSEYARVHPLPESIWRTAVLSEVAERRATPREGSDA